MGGPSSIYLGEFEQLVLLAILRLGAEASGVGIARELEARADRRVARGALYTTLDRLEDKALLRWRVAPGGEDRVEREDDLWHRYRQARVWVTARNRKRSTYVTRDEAPTGAAVMRF